MQIQQGMKFLSRNLFETVLQYIPSSITMELFLISKLMLSFIGELIWIAKFFTFLRCLSKEPLAALDFLPLPSFLLMIRHYPTWVKVGITHHGFGIIDFFSSRFACSIFSVWNELCILVIVIPLKPRMNHRLFSSLWYRSSSSQASAFGMSMHHSKHRHALVLFQTMTSGLDKEWQSYWPDNSITRSPTNTKCTPK